MKSVIEYLKPLAILLPLFIFGSAQAQQSPLETGNTILPICTSKQVTNHLICVSYIAGFLSGVGNQAILSGSKPLFCLPKGVSNGQVVSVFTRYLNEHPEQLHIDVPSLLVFSLGNAFPCEEDKKIIPARGGE
jgi:hypothetical protein